MSGLKVRFKKFAVVNCEKIQVKVEFIILSNIELCFFNFFFITFKIIILFFKLYVSNHKTKQKLKAHHFIYIYI